MGYRNPDATCASYDNETKLTGLKIYRSQVRFEHSVRNKAQRIIRYEAYGGGRVIP